MEVIFTLDFWKFVFHDLATDGYSIYFGIAMAVCLILLAVDIVRYGWVIEEDVEDEN